MDLNILANRHSSIIRDYDDSSVPGRVRTRQVKGLRHRCRPLGAYSSTTWFFLSRIAGGNAVHLGGARGVRVQSGSCSTGLGQIQTRTSTEVHISGSAYVSLFRVEFGVSWILSFHKSCVLRSTLSNGNELVGFTNRE